MKRAKDSVRRLESLLEDARAEAGRAVIGALGEGIPKSELCSLWGTSYSGLDRMIDRARA